MVISDPARALVYIDGKLVGTTPTRLGILRSRTDVVLRIEKDGYNPVDLRLQRSVSGWVAGDIAMAADGIMAGQGGANVPKAVATIARRDAGYRLRHRCCL